LTDPSLFNLEININQRVKVYRNLRKKLFSVLDKKTRRLITYKESLALVNVEFKVSKAGQKKVRKNMQKNVHAYVIGDYIGQINNYPTNYELVYYNPYTTDTFITLNDRKPIFNVNKCFLINGMCYIEL
jgi:hypothetical protein